MSKIINCKTCNKEISNKAKKCPNCGDKIKKPLYKRPWFLILILVVFVALFSDTDSDTTVTEEETVEVISTDPVEVVEEKPEDNVPREYKAALSKAESYSKIMSMSKAGIYDQLTSEYGEKFEADAAQYAIDNMEADWFENALKKAKAYQEMNMSKSAIYDQLISEYGEKFTPEEAQYAIDNLE